MGLQAILTKYGNNFVLFLATSFSDMDTPAVERFCFYGFTPAE